MKYYLFAGYHELFITNRPMREPYSLLSWHKSLDAAQRAAEKFDAPIHYADFIAPDDVLEMLEDGCARREFVDGILFVIC